MYIYIYVYIYIYIYINICEHIHGLCINTYIIVEQVKN